MQIDENTKQALYYYLPQQQQQQYVIPQEMPVQELSLFKEHVDRIAQEVYHNISLKMKIQSNSNIKKKKLL